MQLVHFLAGSLLAAANLAVAAPPAAPTTFQLQTRVTAGNHNKNNLYVVSHHTGAGTSVATLAAGPPAGETMTLNDTAIQVNLNGASFPFYLDMFTDEYADWSHVEIDAIHEPTYGFYFNNSAASVDGLGHGLKWNPVYPYIAPPNNTSGEFGGWLACDWQYGVPQLFWIMRPANFVRLDICSQVELLPVAA